MALPPAVFDRHIPSLDVAGFPQSLEERVHKRCRKRAGELGVEDADHRNRLLLCLDGERRGEEHRTRASEERATVHHWITSSARASSDDGIVRPSALAVFALMTNSNLVGCTT